MIYKLRILFFLGFIILSSHASLYAQGGDGYEVKGQFTSYKYINKVELIEQIFDTIKIIDQTQIDEKGSFNFKGTTNSQHFYFIRFDDSIERDPVPVYINRATHVEITIDPSKAVSFTMKGDKSNEEIEFFYIKNNEFFEKITDLYKKYNRGQLPDSIRDVFDVLVNTLFEERIEKMLNLALESEKSVGAIYAALYMLPPKVTPTQFLKFAFDDNLSKNEEVYIKIDQKYFEHFKDEPLFAYTHNVLKDQIATALGSNMENFTLKNPSGKLISLTDFKGKYVLIDFWASWCGPCREENPNVVQAYSRYHKKGLEILGVSLDNHKNKWKTAILADELNWNQVSDMKGWDGDLVKKLHVTGIPFNILLNPSGKIIAKNLRGAALEEMLREVFGE